MEQNNKNKTISPVAGTNRVKLESSRRSKERDGLLGILISNNRTDI